MTREEQPTAMETSEQSARVNLDALPALHTSDPFNAYDFNKLKAAILAGGKGRREAVEVLARRHVRRWLPDAERGELTAQEARDAQRAIDRNEREITRAFLAKHPTPRQVRLRERVWHGSPYKAVFATLDVATMRFPDEQASAPPSEAPPASEPEPKGRVHVVASQLTTLFRERRDEEWHMSWGRHFLEWRADPDASGTEGEAACYGIMDGAERYLAGQLNFGEELLFEEFFIASAEFRGRAIAELVVEHACVGEDASEPDLDEMDRVYSLFGQVTAGQGTCKQIAEAQAMWQTASQGTMLPAVGLADNELVPHALPLEELSDIELARVWVYANGRHPAADAEIGRRAEAGVSMLETVVVVAAMRMQVEKALGGELLSAPTAAQDSAGGPADEPAPVWYYDREMSEVVAGALTLLRSKRVRERGSSEEDVSRLR